MQPKSKPVALREILLLLLLGILWGMPYALNKLALSTIQPVTMVATRVALAAAALWIFALFKGCRRPKWLDIAPRLFLQGVIGCAIPYALIALAQQSVDSALASVLNSTIPLLVCLIGLLSARCEAQTRTPFIGVLVGLVGVIIITGTGALAGLGNATIGQLAILAASVSSALAAIHARRFDSVEPALIAAGTLSCAALLLLPLAFFFESPQLHTAPSITAIAALLANAFLATAAGFVVYFHLIRSLGSVGTASAGYLRPGVGVLIGCFLLGEPLTPTMIIGLFVILGGIGVINGASDLWQYISRAARIGSLAFRIASPMNVADR